MLQYLALVRESRLLAPNLKEMTLRLFTGEGHRGNRVARAVVRDHLLALRWSNPNAVIYLREARGQGTPTVEYELWKTGAPASAPATFTVPASAAPSASAAASAPFSATMSDVASAAPGDSPAPARRLHRFEVTHTLSPEEVVAKVLMAARDPDDDDRVRGLSAVPAAQPVASSREGEGSAASAGAKEMLLR
jgi:hypothetical protein